MSTISLVVVLSMIFLTKAVDRNAPDRRSSSVRNCVDVCERLDLCKSPKDGRRVLVCSAQKTDESIPSDEMRRYTCKAVCKVPDVNREKKNPTPKSKEGKGYRILGNGKHRMYVKRYDIKASWDKAQEVCRTENASLVKIDSKQKMELIKRKLSKPADQFSKFYMWIGLRDFDKKNVYTWFDGSPCEYISWHKDEPIHKSKSPNGTYMDHDCVIVVRYVTLWEPTVQWSAGLCGNDNGFICEIRTQIR